MAVKRAKQALIELRLAVDAAMDMKDPEARADLEHCAMCWGTIYLAESKATHEGLRIKAEWQAGQFDPTNLTTDRESGSADS